MSTAINVHATGLVLGGHGIVVRGASGAGKSLLALSLIERWTRRGSEALLVADDRLDLLVIDGQLVMQAPERISGLIELRGRGIIRRPFVAEAAVGLIVDLVPDLVRMPDDDAFTTQVLGVSVPRCPVPQAGVVPIEHQMLLVEEAMLALPDAGDHQNTT